MNNPPTALVGLQELLKLKQRHIFAFFKFEFEVALEAANA
jgi:hypothetical protein